MNASTTIYKFAEFTLNPAKRKLFQNETEIELGNRDFDVLLCLIENRPNVLSHDDIIKVVWDGAFIENNVVEKAISSIRNALTDDFKNPLYVKTVRSRGYFFVGDVEEVTEDAQEKPQVLETKPQSQILKETKQSWHKQKWRTVAICILFLGGTFSLNWWNGEEIWANMTAKIILRDDFSSEKLDSRWKPTGKTVRVNNGILELRADEADNFGRITSDYFSFDPNKRLTIKSRLKIQYMQFSKDKTYFGGDFQFIPKTPDSDTHAGLKPLLWGVSYKNSDHEGIVEYPSGTYEYIKVKGFYLVRDGGRAADKQHYWEGKVGPRIEPIWGEWFEQKITYKPWNGDIEYFINGEKKAEYNVGKLRENRIGNQLRFWIHAGGWYLHHSMDIDYIEVTQ